MARSRLKTDALPEQGRAVGVYASDLFGEVLPANAKGVEVSVTRISWPTRSAPALPPNATKKDVGKKVKEEQVMRLAVDLSLDNGVSWRTMARCGAPGGDVLTPEGVTAPATVLGFGLPNIGSTTRRIRFRVRCRNPLRAAAHIDVIT